MSEAAKTKKPDKTTSFLHRESPSFRVVHVDGAFGGLTPTGKVYAAMYSQLPPIPTLVVQEVSEEGKLGDEVQREISPHIDRVLEVGLVMDLSTATVFRDWLDRKITELQELVKPKG